MKKKYHLLALFTAVIWGLTLVSTKVLLNCGLDAAEIIFYRFILAYFLLCIFYPKFNYKTTLKDELLILLAGFFGGALYFISENEALNFTYVSNVSLLISLSPLLTFLISTIFNKQKYKLKVWIGSFIALFGVLLVAFNGNVILNLNPLGDVLSLVAAFSWAIYCTLLQNLQKRYNLYILTRKVFFYGIVVLIPLFAFKFYRLQPQLLLQVPVIFNLLFLAVIASFVCYLMWGSSIKHLGAVTTNNYVYIIPLVTLFASFSFLGERITSLALVGALLIILGVFCVQNFKNH